jgi:hypothetical protein
MTKGVTKMLVPTNNYEWDQPSKELKLFPETNIPQLDQNRYLTGGTNQEANFPTLMADNNDNFILPNTSLTLPKSDSLIAESSTIVTDPSVDSLTGEAMPKVYEALKNFAADPDFTAKMNEAFGDSWDTEKAKALTEEWIKGDFSSIPPVKDISGNEIPGANGAYVAETNTIYVSKDFLANATNPAAVVDVLLEEIGHSIDSHLNVKDSLGDEGSIFATNVQGKDLSQSDLRALKSEDDHDSVVIDGHKYLLEKQLNPAGSIGSFYNSHPTIAQALGRDTGAEFEFSPGKWRQNFERGAIFHSANGTFSVHGSLGSYYLNNLRGENSQLGLPTSEEFQYSNGNWRQSFEKGTLEWLSNGTAKVTLTATQTQVPANNWKSEYFNNTNLTGSPVYVENLGDGSQGLSINWGTGSRPNTPSDNFSARMTTQRSLAPGLYQIKVQADDGVRVKIGNQSVIDRWFDQPFVTNSGYFRSNGGTVPIAIDYYERVGSAALKFDIIPATKFRDSVDYTQQWKSTVYSWNSSQGSAPPTNFWEGDINSPNAIGEINLGSNTRSDGKKGINVNWGTGAPNGDGNRLPHDFFAMRAFTQADFDGNPYKFRVQGDDGFQLLAKNQSTGKWYDITPKNQSNQWTQAYSPTEFTSQLPAGRYDMHFHQYEGGGDARFDLSWEKMGNPKLDIQLSYPKGGFTSSEINLMEKAAQNWERIITKDKDSSGVLKISVVKGLTDPGNVAQTNQESAFNSRTNFGGPNVDINGVDYHNNITFNPNDFSRMVNGNVLVRLAMHEIGHTLGLSHEGGVSLMSHNNFDAKMTDSMYNTMTAEGYSIDRNVPINWY